MTVLTTFSFITVLAAAPAAPAAERLQVSLRAAPRVADAPARILFTAEVSGGEDGEELYCPTLEWAWGDGTRSVQEGSCPPYKTGETEVQRMFSADHEYRRPGRPRVTLVMRKGERTLGRAEVNVIIARKGARGQIPTDRRPRPRRVSMPSVANTRSNQTCPSSTCAKKAATSMAASRTSVTYVPDRSRLTLLQPPSKTRLRLTQTR